MTHLSDDHGRALVRFARAAIGEALGGPAAVPPDGPWSREPGASFVTLRRHGELHGCIGSVEARRRLVDDVAQNAVAAALRDPRGRPIGLRDVADLTVELSLLSPLERIPFTDEASAERALVPDVDGVVLRWHGRQGTFLPQVWADLSDPHEFMAHLKHKAGLPADFWAPGVELYRYRVDKWIDPARSRRREEEPS